jgi:hypothetical protein
MSVNILGCEVPNSTLEAWSNFFVFLAEPFYLDLESRDWLPNTKPRLQFKPSLEFSDAYLTYSIPTEASFIATLEPQEFRALSPVLQTKLVALQIQFHRGQIYSLEFLRAVLGEIPAWLGVDIFDQKFVLHLDTWNAFTPEIRYKWLTAYVSIDREQCRSSVVPKDVWAQLSAQVRALAGTFSCSSGANCFATVIAGLTPDLKESQRISRTWMLEHEFLAALETRGFRDVGQLEFPVQPHSVITWHTDRTIHGSLVLGHDLVLNKDAQSWFAPRQLRSLENVLEAWAQDASDVRMWIKSTG